MSIEVKLSPRHIQALRNAACSALRNGPYGSLDEADALDHAVKRLERAMSKHRVPIAGASPSPRQVPGASSRDEHD